MPTESNRFFGSVISRVGKEGARECSLWQSKCVWLDVEEESTASNRGNDIKVWRE